MRCQSNIKAQKALAEIYPLKLFCSFGVFDY